MKKRALALNPVLAAIVLGACSTSPTMPDKAWKVAPVQTVRHGGTDNAAGYFALGRYKEGRGANGEAIAAYRKAVDADPGHAAAWNALGALQMRLGQIDDGLRALEQAVKLAPAASHLHNNLGYAQMLAGRDDAALMSLRRAVELDPNNRRAWSNLAALYLRLGMRAEAERADARANGARPAAPASRPAPAAHLAPGTMPATAAGAAVVVSPLGMESPVATPLTPLAAEHRAPSTAPGDNPSTRVSVGPSATVSGPTVTTAPQAVLVKIAENVYELHNGPAKPADVLAEATAIITAAASPSSPASAMSPQPAARPLATSFAPPAVPTANPPAQAPAPTAAHDRESSTPAIAGAPTIPGRAPRYEITNGHGGEGLARRLAGLLAKQGVARPRLTNHSAYNQPATFVEYRDGYRDAAEAFAARLPFRPAIVPATAGGLIVDVRLMLGRDLTTSDACAVLELCRAVARPAAGPIKVAQAASHTSD